MPENKLTEETNINKVIKDSTKLNETVSCKFCGNMVLSCYAHLHEGEWVGDECCWDERLKTTE